MVAALAPVEASATEEFQLASAAGLSSGGYSS